MEFNKPCIRFRTCKELLQAVRRLDEEGNEVSVSEMTELEEEISVALMHIRSRKTQLLMERLSTFREQEKKLTEEKEELEQQVASAKLKGYADNINCGGGLDDTATNHNNQTNPPPQQILLKLPLSTPVYSANQGM